MEFGGDWLSRPFEKTVEDARKLELAKLTKEAEDERSARVKLENKIAPRRVDLEQRKSIAAALISFRGRKVRLESYALDVEAAVFGKQLAAAFARGGLPPIQALLTRDGGGSVAFGIHVSGKDGDLVKAIVAALKGANLLVVEGDETARGGVVVRGGGAMIGFGPPPAEVTDANVFIGVKPIAE